MVVLVNYEMLTQGGQYLQPEFSSYTSSADSKTSPLALLAQTCSQIGADTSNSKAIIPPLEKKKSALVEVGAAEKSDKSSDKLTFKPYECHKKDDSSKGDEPKRVKTPKQSSSPSSVTSTASTHSSTSSPKVSCVLSSETTTTTSSTTTKPTETSSAGASPIIRSGLEVLQGHQKDIPLGTYKPGLGHLSAVSCASVCPPGFDPTAYRSAFPTPPMFGYQSHLAAAAAAAAAAASPLQYMQYARVKTAGESFMPVCKDPYCTGCQYSLPNTQLLAAAAAASGGGVCPSGCTQCDHQKLAFPYLQTLAPPPTSMAAAAAAAAYSQNLLSAQRPYQCNWIVGDTYCGKRFATSDELLQHLRTHTNLSTSDAAAAAAVASNPLSLLSPVTSQPHPSLLASPLHRSPYPNPPLSPLSAARYHPYGKPGLPAASLQSSPLTPLIPPHPSLASYYSSPYALYGQRLGAAVHP